MVHPVTIAQGKALFISKMGLKFVSSKSYNSGAIQKDGQSHASTPHNGFIFQLLSFPGRNTCPRANAGSPPSCSHQRARAVGQDYAV
jgi:hypothetical protein